MVRKASVEKFDAVVYWANQVKKAEEGVRIQWAVYWFILGIIRQISETGQKASFKEINDRLVLEMQRKDIRSNNVFMIISGGRLRETLLRLSAMKLLAHTKENSERLAFVTENSRFALTERGIERLRGEEARKLIEQHIFCCRDDRGVK
ncbi:MAG: hypothetical protein WC242_04370 [Candidatus Paceibacterota bacterium]|jgi:hypothetical protein